MVKVDLSNNEISDVPDEIGALTNLTTFRIRNNRIVTLSDKLFTTCTGIVHLDLSSNAITELSNSIGKLQFLAELYLSGNRLRAIPEYVCECTRLTILEVADNLLEDLPAAIGALRHLLRLNAAINRISEVPDSLCAISSLQDLDLKKNKISILPDLRGMTSLTVIDVSDNKLELYPSFPPGERSALARIYLGGNRIRHLPGENLVAGENTLVELDVQGNLLTEISPDIGILKNLKLLNASNNDLSDIPFTLGYMTSLQRYSFAYICNDFLPARSKKFM